MILTPEEQMDYDNGKNAAKWDAENDLSSIAMMLPPGAYRRGYVTGWLEATR